MQNWPFTVVLAAVGIFTLGACGAPSSAPPPSAAAPPSAPATTPSPPSPAPSVSAPDSLVTDALKNVQCAADAHGTWSFSGTLHNTGTASVKYTIAIAVGTTSSVAGHAMIEKEVAAGASTEVRAAEVAQAAPAGSTCDAVVSK